MSTTNEGDDWRSLSKRAQNRVTEIVKPILSRRGVREAIILHRGENGVPSKVQLSKTAADMREYVSMLLAKAGQTGITAQAVAAAMNRYNIKGQHLKGRPSAKISATDLRKNIKNYPKWTIVERAKYFCMDSKTLLKHAEFLGVPVPRAGKKYGRPPTVLLSEVKKYFQLNPEASLTEAANYFGVSTSLICKLLKN